MLRRSFAWPLVSNLAATIHPRKNLLPSRDG
jgi:hypothetical protein